FESISIGTINGHFYMIQGLIDAMKEDYLIKNIIFTGGNLRYYTDSKKSHNIIFDETLILKGLVYLYQQLHSMKSASYVLFSKSKTKIIKVIKHFTGNIPQN